MHGTDDRTTASRLEARALQARILLERDGLLVVDKPHDLPTSGRTLDDPDCLQHALIERAGRMVWAVHQLDADTSGVNVFVTERALVEPAKRALAASDAIKEYLAVVHGVPAWDETLCEAPIGGVDDASLGVTPTGRAARSCFRVEARFAEHARLAVRIATGRTHQIRIHASHLGHPLVGEEWYREPPCTLHPRQALHAARVRLAAPFDVELEAPTPDDLAALLDRFERSGARGTGHRAQPD